MRQRPLMNNQNYKNNQSFDQSHSLDPSGKSKNRSGTKFRKILLLIIAVTVHNIPGKL